LGNAVELTQGETAIATSVGMSAMADGFAVFFPDRKVSAMRETAVVLDKSA
jgi:hypothetical protein